MQQIKNTEFGGERPLFASHDLQIDNVTIHAGESALKECSNIIVVLRENIHFGTSMALLSKTVCLLKEHVLHFGIRKI